MPQAVTVAFDGGRPTSDGGVTLLPMAERRVGIADRLAHCFSDSRDPERVTRTLADMIRARVFAIGRGCGDCSDLDALRKDPASLQALAAIVRDDVPDCVRGLTA